MAQSLFDFGQSGTDVPQSMQRIGRHTPILADTVVCSLFDADLHDVVANDDHVVGLVTATVRVGDEAFTYRTAEIVHVKDGKVTERWAFSDDTQAITDFSRFG